ncbi:MAG: SMP-30/gluconolactonase/LRE family protein, partial [Rhodospirillaceae bacterium]|nr:SMP-30/gluconolactonase/LRE family protein [Rhodospirillaceae bacterium]
MSDVVVAANMEDVLGEVPVWDANAQCLWWTDVFRPAIHRLDAASGEVESWTPPDKVHSFALRQNDGLVIAGRKGFARYDPVSGAYELLHDPRGENDGTMLNDGRADRQGRFWAGTMDKMLKAPTGHLYRLDADGTSHAEADNITLSNGVAFSPDGGTLYFADSLLKTIFAYDLAADSG